MRKWTRRTFIGAGSLVGGGFVLGIAGVTFAPSRHSVVSADATEKGELTESSPFLVETLHGS